MTFEEMKKQAETVHSMVIVMTLALDAAKDHNRQAGELVPAMREIDNQLTELTEAMAIALHNHHVDML